MMNENQTISYNYVIDKLEKAKNPEIMLNELVLNRGTPYITEDMVFIIERRIHDEWERMNNILLANPKLTLQEFPGYRDKIEKLEQIRDIFNERAGLEVKSHHEKTSKVESEPTHKLAAVMFTDIVGYTALMGKDEDSAFNLLHKNRELQKPIIEKYKGTWIKELGDGVMATFNTAFEAVQAAIKIQNSCNADYEFELRIGIHLGDVIFENNDIFGDAVNIAARIQNEARPGSIYISEPVNFIILNKHEIKTNFVKEASLKNVKSLTKLFEIIIDLPKKNPKAPNVEIIWEPGSIINPNGSAEMTVGSSIFFSYRLSDSFPGIRKLTWFEDPKTINERLAILLRPPLVFDMYPEKKYKIDQYLMGVKEPVWWFRGGARLPINEFQKLSDSRCLIGGKMGSEFSLDKLAVFRHSNNKRSFVYVQVKGEVPVLFTKEESEEYIKEQLKIYHYAKQDYGIYNGKLFSLEEYQDGSALIDNKIVSLNGDAGLITRYLTKYNFIISSGNSIYGYRNSFQVMERVLDKLISESEDILEKSLSDILEIEPEENELQFFDEP